MNHRRNAGYWWGVVVAIGGAFAITAYYDDNPAFAVILAVATIITAMLVYVRVDKAARPDDQV